MRIEMDSINMTLPEELRRHAEMCVWLALHRLDGRVRWAGVRFSEEPDAVMCEIDAWLAGIGPLAVRHADADPYIAADRAAARLKYAAGRRLEMAETSSGGREERVLCEV
jgi:hypothetical protein